VAQGAAQEAVVTPHNVRQKSGKRSAKCTGGLRRHSTAAMTRERGAIGLGQGK